MIGIHTSILLRLMTRDDPVQADLAERLTSSADQAILMGASNAEAGARRTFAFDQDAAAHPWFTLVELTSPG